MTLPCMCPSPLVWVGLVTITPMIQLHYKAKGMEFCRYN